MKPEKLPHEVMKSLIRLEELFMFLSVVFLYYLTPGHSWWLFALLFFAPDLSFFAYFINNRAGAYCYNLLHHRGLMAVLAASGFILDLHYLLLTGLIFLSHSTFDRIFGYGLKYPDHFKNTHLGRIG